MPFADTVITRGNKQSDTRKTEFMQVGQGAHTIRILQPQAKTYPTHFFKGRGSVLCLEEECPICANNRSLWLQFDKEAKKQQSYNAKQYRFYVNVLDKTPAKVCECGKEYKALERLVCDCGKQLPAPAPLNKIKVLNKGITLRNDLDSIDNAIQYPANHENAGTPIGLMNYDIVLMVSGTGNETKVTPIPRTDSNQPVELGEQQLYDLEKIILVFTPEEMLDVQRGVSIKDIFAARRAKEASEFNPETFEKTVEPIVTQETLDEVNAKVSSLFNQQ